jgi:hypothetical protein
VVTFLGFGSGGGPEIDGEWDGQPRNCGDWLREAMARASFSMYQSYLGMAGNPIEWTDRYALSDRTPEEESAAPHENDDSHGFAHYNSRISDLTPRGQRHSGGDAFISHEVCAKDDLAHFQRGRLHAAVDE